MVENCSEQGDILLSARLGAQDFLEMILHIIVECQDIYRQNVARQPLHLLRHFSRVDQFEMSDRVDEAAGEPSARRSEEHTSELQSLMRISYAVFCLKKKKQQTTLLRTDHKFTLRIPSTT